MVAEALRHRVADSPTTVEALRGMCERMLEALEPR